MTTKGLISVYSDGSSSGSSKGATGWGWIVTDHTNIYTAGCEGSPEGTNNTAELQGAIHGLRAVVDRKLHEWNRIELVSDSTYVLGLGAGEFKAQKNTDLVKTLRTLVIQTEATCRWVRGHSGDAFNEKVDKLAKLARDRYLPDTNKLKRRRVKREERRRRRAIVKAYKRGYLNYVKDFSASF